MKKLFVIMLVFIAIIAIIDGVMDFGDINLQPIKGSSITDWFNSLSHNYGVLLKKLLQIGIGVGVIKFCYDWFCDEEALANEKESA
nr:hypothetical protein [uncultured Flavobacterium sp.]